MLAIFQNSMCDGPRELLSPRITRTSSISGRLDAQEIVHKFKVAHPEAVLMQFDDRHALAYTSKQTSLLRPRQFAVSDDVFCAFTGNLSNLPQLRQQYGLDRHISEVDFVIEAYKVLRDRAPYPADQVIKSLDGAFAFVLYDNKQKKVFVASDSYGKVPLYWGKCLDDGVLAFSDDAAVLKCGCGSSFAPFPLGCFYSSMEGLHSFQHPTRELKAIPHVDSEGQLCGSNFRVDSETNLHRLDV